MRRDRVGAEVGLSGPEMIWYEWFSRNWAVRGSSPLGGSSCHHEGGEGPGSAADLGGGPAARLRQETGLDHEDRDLTLGPLLILRIGREHPDRPVPPVLAFRA